MRVPGIKVEDGELSINAESSNGVDVSLKGAKLTDAQLVKHLEDALANFVGTPCTFWACQGPRRPRHMVTCTRCWAIRHVNIALAALKRRVMAKAKPKPEERIPAPSANVFWSDVPWGASVKLVGKVGSRCFVAELPSGRAVIYWTGSQPPELDRWAANGKRS